MKKLIALAAVAAILLSCFCIVASAEATTAAQEEPKVAPTATAVYGDCLIDGELDDNWKFAQINYITNVFTDNELNSDPAQARFRLMYDDQYLYYYVEVYDISMSSIEHELGAGNSWYNRDGVAFVFSPDGNKDETPGYTKPAFWYIIRAFGSAANYNQVGQNVFVTEKEGAVIADQNDFEKTPMTERMYFTKQIKDASGAYTGYVVEGKVNLLARLNECKEELNLTVPEKMTAGMNIGFDMYINDCNYLLISNSRDYGLNWSSINSYKNNAEKGTVVLAEKSVMFNDPQDGFPKAVEEITEEETTKAPEGETTPASEVTTSAPEVTTEAAEVTTAEETKAAEVTTAEQKSEKKGCGSAVMGFAIIAIVGTAFVVKKH